MTIRVEKEGIESCISKIRGAIDTLKEAASTIDTTMGELPAYWEGAAYNKAEETYEEQYKTLLTQTVPEFVEDFRSYINTCMQTIIEIDQ